MVEYEALKAAREMDTAEREKFEREHRGEKMTLHDFELALHKLLDDAMASGLAADEIQEVADAIVNNTFLPDDESLA